MRISEEKENDAESGVCSLVFQRSFRKIIDHLIYRGAQGIILSCTEIRLLVGQGNHDAPSLI
jgi:aspartate/glutamate racemase